MVSTWVHTQLDEYTHVLPIPYPTYTPCKRLGYTIGIPIDGYRCKVPNSYSSKRYATCRQVRTQVNWREIYRENVMLQLQHSNVTFLIGRMFIMVQCLLIHLRKTNKACALA